MRKYVPLLIVIAAVAAYVWSSRSGESPFIEQRFTLDSSVTIRIYGMPEAKAKSTAAAAFSTMEKIGESAYPASGEMSPDTKALKPMVDKAFAYSKLSGGAFNPAIGAIVSLWGVGEIDHLPTDAEIEEALGKTGAGGEGGQLDFGGVAKGYAIDEATKTLRRRGARSALISAVSSTSALGSKPRGKEWRVGVENPRKGRGPSIIAELKLPPGANVSTSGDYQKFFIRNGKRYHHIFDPKTGRPAAGLMSVTVVTDLPAADADILSTALFVMGQREGAGFLSEHPEKFSKTGALIVTSSGKIIATPGLDRYLIKHEKSIVAPNGGGR